MPTIDQSTRRSPRKLSAAARSRVPKPLAELSIACNRMRRDVAVSERIGAVVDLASRDGVIVAHLRATKTKPFVGRLVQREMCKARGSGAT